VTQRLAHLQYLAQRYLTAISLTFFANSARTGLAVLLILAAAAPLHAAAAVAASALARLSAGRAGASRALLNSGLVELNGWFLGLACATFFGPSLALVVAVVIGGLAVAPAAIALQRVLATWDLPLLVCPYLPIFWLLWAGLSGLPWVSVAPLPVMPPPSDLPVVTILIGGMRGIGQIFFLPDATIGLALAVAACLANWRIGLAMMAASLGAIGIGFLVGAPAWEIEQGLPGFTPALVAAAALPRFLGMGRVAVAAAVLTSPFLETAAIRLAGSVGLFALSSTFVGFVWLFALMRPVRQAGDARDSWSMRGAPRSFETGRPATSVPVAPAGANGRVPPALRRIGAALRLGRN
jgi:urea transporter